MGNIGSRNQQDQHTLVFSKKERLPRDTETVQVDDGTVFYFRWYSPARTSVYVKRRRGEVSVDLTTGSCTNLTAHGNTVYFTTRKYASSSPSPNSSPDSSDSSSPESSTDVEWNVTKIWKAEFDPRNEKIQVTHFRVMKEGEKEHGHGLFSNIYRGRTYAYRIFDKPSNGVPVVGSECDIDLAAVHQRRAYYVDCDTEANSPIARQINDNLVVIEWEARECRVCVYSHRDSSPFLYLTNNKTAVHILDTRTMEVVKELQISVPNIITRFVGFNELTGVVTAEVLTELWNGDDVMTARMATNHLGSSNPLAQGLSLFRRKERSDPVAESNQNGMGNADSNGEDQKWLVFSEKETLDEGTMAYQVYDGTIFYVIRKSDETKIYVKYKGTRVYADESFSKIDNVSAHGDAIFFTAKEKFSETRALHKAVFLPPNYIAIDYSRALREEEEIHDENTCTRIHKGKTYVYRIFDGPDRGIVVDLPEEEWWELGCIHQGRAYYSRPRAKNDKRNENIVMIEWTVCQVYTSRDACPFLYLTNQEDTLYVLDTRTLELVRELKFDVPERIAKFLGFSNGVVTLLTYRYDRTKDSEDDEDYYVFSVMTAPLAIMKPATAGLSNTKEKEFESTFLKEFEPRGILGEGAYGRVFEAYNFIDKTTYAVKRIHPTADDVDDALKEVCVLAALKHEGIVDYKHAWKEEPPEGWQRKQDAELLKKLGLKKMKASNERIFIYIKMELCKQSLHQWLSENEERDLTHVKEWFKQIVAAVHFLHQKNKIHRDLKPHNILIDNSGRVKICDLGLIADQAWKDGHEFDITRSHCGTPMYRPMEQEASDDGRNYTSKVDIYSLGLILAEMCEYMPKDKAYVEFMKYQGGQPTTILKNLPEVDQLVTWMTKYEPKERPSCEEILNHSFLA